jgi:hypothetical protein
LSRGSNADSFPDRHGNGNCHCDRNGYPKSYSYSNRNRNCHRNRHGYGNSYSGCHTHRNGDSNTQRDADSQFASRKYFHPHAR